MQSQAKTPTKIADERGIYVPPLPSAEGNQVASTAAREQAAQKLRKILRKEQPSPTAPDAPKSILKTGTAKDDKGKPGLFFDEIVEVLPTLNAKEYSRRPDPDSTFRNLTPVMKGFIREEINQYKAEEMPVHPESVGNICLH
ncbi:hypothetical protein DFJ74DRAFT_645659 [Hyaloraphidium curvatum]|nr:hypothetical protein DFJ74DRAFT_645659 [Hyaloraphidium curvatum]